MMLPKKKRLNTEDFNRFFASGKRYHSPSLQIIHTPHHSFHGAVVVGKKVSKKAVTRNTLRRRLYNHLYYFCKLHDCSGVFIVLTKSSAVSVLAQQLQAELTGLLTKIESKG
ncbi:MAG: ribonuclease P protein component [Candidatus Paceibacterota bacterium]